MSLERRQQQVDKQLATCSPMFRPILVKAYAGTASPRSAIKAMCLECVGYDRDAIRGCTGYSCPLWTYRPYQIEGVA